MLSLLHLYISACNFLRSGCEIKRQRDARKVQLRKVMANHCDVMGVYSNRVRIESAHRWDVQSVSGMWEG